jgi:hypothetical protein
MTPLAGGKIVNVADSIAKETEASKIAARMLGAHAPDVLEALNQRSPRDTERFSGLLALTNVFTPSPISIEGCNIQ